MDLTGLDIHIYEGMFRLYHWLGRLKLNFNRIEKIPSELFIGLINLFDLDLSFNEIKQIDNDGFKGLSSLRRLDLTHNNLETLTRSSLAHLKMLEELLITENNIKEVELDIFNDLLRLESLHSDEFRFCCIAKQADVCLPEPDEFSSCEDLMSNFALQVSSSCFQ